MSVLRRNRMRGLEVFISDMRNSKSKEDEIKRINRELANIRGKFKADHILDGCQKKKYICKLLYVFLMGHEINFGHLEAVNLLSSNKYSEKQVGYLFISLLAFNDSKLMDLIMQNVNHDLVSGNPAHVNLALQCIASMGGKEMAKLFGNQILRLLVSSDTNNGVKQTAALCLLTLFRSYPQVIPSGEWTARIIHLLADHHLGVVTSATSLIHALATKDLNEYIGCVPLAVSRLSRITLAHYTYLPDYTYYSIPAPWLSIKLLRLLQNYTPLPDFPNVTFVLNQCLKTIFRKYHEPSKIKKIQHANIKNAVFFEVVVLIALWNNKADFETYLGSQFDKFLSSREANLRYLVLETMCNCASSKDFYIFISRFLKTVLLLMKTEQDTSIRHKAVDLLYAMCDETNYEDIVQEMLTYLEISDYSIRYRLVLKVTVLSEKYAVDYRWYLDVILNLLRIADAYISEEVIHRAIQIVVNRREVQAYAAKTLFEAIQASACSENLMKMGGYILGEFGNLIAGARCFSLENQLQLLHSRYFLCSSTTRAVLLSTYIKFVNFFPELRHRVQGILRRPENIRSTDLELQQRSSEYLQLSVISYDFLAAVLEQMPAYSKPSFVNSGRRNQLECPSDSQKTIKISGGSGTVPVGNLGLALSFSQLYLQNYEDVSDFQQSVAFATFLGSTEGYSTLYENDQIRVDVKDIFREHCGCVQLLYVNKTSSSLVHFVSSPVWPNRKTAPYDHIKPYEQDFAVGATLQQDVNVECIDGYVGAPILTVSFVYNDALQEISIKLPLTINRFLQPASMSAEVFLYRWRCLNRAHQEGCLKISNTNSVVDLQRVRMVLIEFGLQILDGIDPNPDNFVCAGIVRTRNRNVGCLLRLELNRRAQMYKVTVRSNKEGVSAEICDTLVERLKST